MGRVNTRIRTRPESENLEHKAKHDNCRMRCPESESSVRSNSDVLCARPVTGSGGGQVLESVTTYNVPRREDWFVEGFQNLCKGVETNHNRSIGSSCVSLR